MKELENMNLITVFTPTYNRAYCLNKCYESMQKQSCKAFDWLIVDDGSTDNTKELVEKWIKQKTEFNIRYIYKENGGMHTAYNTAYANIDTELSVNVDSDDYLTDTAIEDILSFWKKNKRENIGAIYALDQYEDGNVVGTPFPNDLKEFKGWGYKNIVFYFNFSSSRCVIIFYNKKENKEMKIAIIIAYFGKLPEYIQLFLDSCKLNYGFEWLIFSDDDTTYNYPSNVHLIKMNFGECKKLIQSKFDFEITLSKPQKLCDYKCAYGVIFEDYIQDYDWWGHCDLDQIFGNLNMFVTEDMLRKYDKLFSLGHLSLYKNSYKNNRIFMGKIEGKIRYKEVFVTERGCGFDEWLPGNVNDIYMQTNSPIMLENIGADINPYKTSFETVSFDINERCYKSNLIRNSIFEVAKGHLFQIYSVNGELHTREFPYVHLQKRKMRDLRKNKNSDNYYLIPNCFIDKDINPSVLLRVCTIWRVFNYQFFRVKINSLKYRFKNSDWKFTNVFK